MRAKYKRVLLKISGEALAGTNGFGLDEHTIAHISENIKKIVDMGVQVSIVVGGGNIWRGRSSENMDRTRADHMGMLATAINALALCSALENCNVPTRVQTAIEMRQVAEPYIRGKAERHLEKGRVIRLCQQIQPPHFVQLKQIHRLYCLQRKLMQYMTATLI